MPNSASFCLTVDIDAKKPNKAYQVFNLKITNMKRRIFLSTASTVGIVGAVSSASLVSSAYSSISTGVLLQEFGSATKSALDNFVSNVKANIKQLGLDEKLAEQITMPTQIISNTAIGSNQNITYKNKSGQYVQLSVTDGVDRVIVSASLS